MKTKDLDTLARALPSDPGLEGRDEYFNSVVLLLLIPIRDELHIVFEKRAPGIRQGGEISLPGGRRDDSDDSDEATAIRETTEELGIRKGKIKIIGRLDSVFAPMGAMVDVFVGTADVIMEDITINPDEVEKAFAIPVSYFEEHNPEEYRVIIEVHPDYIDKSTGRKVVLLPSEELGLPDRYKTTWGGFKHKVYAYRTSEGTIWGITARIVRNFVERIKET